MKRIRIPELEKIILTNIQACPPYFGAIPETEETLSGLVHSRFFNPVRVYPMQKHKDCWGTVGVYYGYSHDMRLLVISYKRDENRKYTDVIVESVCEDIKCLDDFINYVSAKIKQREDKEIKKVEEFQKKLNMSLTRFRELENEYNCLDYGARSYVQKMEK